jgi:hypothetical protein
VKKWKKTILSQSLCLEQKAKPTSLTSSTSCRLRRCSPRP